VPRNVDTLLELAEAALSQQSVELSATRARQLQSVRAEGTSGTGHIDAAFSLNVRFRLVFVRCHFNGTNGRNPLTLSVDSRLGAAHDAELFTIERAGVGRDVNLRISEAESRDPSPWTFQAGDAVRIQWTNPDPGSLTWGLTVGLAMAS